MTEDAYKTCPKCGLTSREVKFFDNVTSTYCANCSREYQKTLYHLKKANPYPIDHRCDICGKSEDELPVNFGGKTSKRLTPWRLDHCHETNTFRGFLCSNCNSGLGRFGDDIEVMQKAIDYLLAHKEKTAMQDSA